MTGYTPKPRWSQRQKAFLIDNYANMKDEQIAQHIGRSIKSVRRMRERLGLKKMSGRGICAAHPDAQEYQRSNILGNV